MQQAYVELLSGNARFNNKSSLKTFVFAVVQNLAKNRFRRLTTRLRLLRQHAVLNIDTDVEPPQPDQSAGIWSAVRALPARQRDIIELVFCRELTIEEASQVMGVTTGTGRVHYDRAKKALRERLEESLLDET